MYNGLLRPHSKRQSVSLSRTSSTSASNTSPIPIGPLSGSFPILSLRTNKADVVVAVDEEVAEKLERSGEKWRYNGKYVHLCHPSPHHVPRAECYPDMRWCCSNPAEIR